MMMMMLLMMVMMMMMWDDNDLFSIIFAHHKRLHRNKRNKTRLSQDGYIHCSPIVWNHPTSASVFLRSQWKSMLISSECPFKRPPLTLLQNFTVKRRFCLAPISSWGVRISLVARKDNVAHLYRTHSAVCEEHRSVTRWHLQSTLSCSGGRKSYPNATWASVEDDHTVGRPRHYPNHEEKHVSIIVDSRSRADQTNWTSCFCPRGLKTFGSSWVSLKTSTQMLQTDSWSSPPTAAYGHAGTGTRTISNGPMWYLLMSPGSTITTVMVPSEFVGVLVGE